VTGGKPDPSRPRRPGAWTGNCPDSGGSDRHCRAALKVTWFSVEILNAAGKRAFFNSFVTDLTVTAANVAELGACGRPSLACSVARWKIENETFNVLKTGDYHLEHNFGHGKQTLACVLVALNLLAFAFHTASMLAVLAWKQAMAARGAAYRFFEHLRTIVAYVVFENWDRETPLLSQRDHRKQKGRSRKTSRIVNLELLLMCI
jgi:hypothetical protein